MNLLPLVIRPVQQLEIARERVRAQLDELDRSRTRLETAIAEADAVAYWESAGTATGTTQTTDLP